MLACRTENHQRKERWSMGHPQLNFLGDFDLFKPYEVSLVLLSYLVRHPRVSAFILCIRDVLTCWCSFISQRCMDFALSLIVERILIYFFTRAVIEAFKALKNAVKFQSKANVDIFFQPFSSEHFAWFMLCDDIDRTSTRLRMRAASRWRNLKPKSRWKWSASFV